MLYGTLTASGSRCRIKVIDMRFPRRATISKLIFLAVATAIVAACGGGDAEGVPLESTMIPLPDSTMAPPTIGLPGVPRETLEFVPEDTPTPGPGPTASPTPEPERKFQTSGGLTELTFTRELAVPFNSRTGEGLLTQNASFKISGYLKEVEPRSHPLTLFNDRAYELEDGTVEWTFSEYQSDGGERCTYVTTVSGSGRKSISDLDVHYGVNDGRGADGQLNHIARYDLRVGFREEGLSGRSECSLVGELLFPVVQTYTVMVNRSTAVCSGRRTSETIANRDVAIVRFPLTLLDLDPDQAYHSGVMTVREAVENEMEGTVLSGHKNVEFGPLVAVTSITILGTDGPWEVGWEIRLPFEPPILEVQEPQVTPLTVSMPDLTPISCTVTPENPTESDRVRVEVEVRNDGNAVAKFPRNAREHTMVRADGSLIRHFALASGRSIDPGDIHTFRLGWDPFSHAAGPVEFKVIVDPGNRLAESDEGNNEILCSPFDIRTATEFPDLVITDLALDLPVATPQNGFVLRAKVANRGGKDAEISGISLVLFGGPYTNLVYPPQGGFRLGPGEEQTIEMVPTRRGSEVGSNTWTITVDSGDRVRESNEENNTRTIEVMVAPAGPVSGPAPDLAPVSCSVTPESPTEADEVLIEIVVENAGDAVADFPRSASGHTILRADGSPIQHFDRASGWLIEPGDTRAWESGLMPNSHPPGTLEFKAVIDPQNRVGESNEDNNEILCPAVVVRAETDPPDLTITALTLDPPEATRQNGFVVRATVANIGGRDAQINGISLVLFGGPYTNLVYPPREGGFRLGPGESQVFEMIPTEQGVEPGTTTWTIEVDPGNQVRESDETNNQREITVTVAR